MLSLVESYVGKLPDAMGFKLELRKYAKGVYILARIYETEESIGILNEMPLEKERFLTTLLFHLESGNYLYHPKLLANAIQAYEKGAGTRETWTAEAVVKRTYDKQALCILPNGESVWVWINDKLPKRGETIKIKATRRVNWYGEEEFTAVKIKEKDNGE